MPLKTDHNSGGWQWDATKKAEYANYLDAAEHLIAMTGRVVPVL